MARKFSELRSKMSPESQARARARADEILREMSLDEIRRARDLTQQQLANELRVNQAWISKVERQADMYLSTLRAYIEAAGGVLDVQARFGNQVFRISQLSQFDGATTVAVKTGSESTIADEPASISLYQSAKDVAQTGYSLWGAEESNTGQSRTPSSNLTPPSKAAA